MLTGRLQAPSRSCLCHSVGASSAERRQPPQPASGTLGTQDSSAKDLPADPQPNQKPFPGVYMVCNS